MILLPHRSVINPRTNDTVLDRRWELVEHVVGSARPGWATTQVYPAPGRWLYRLQIPPSGHRRTWRRDRAAPVPLLPIRPVMPDPLCVRMITSRRVRPAPTHELPLAAPPYWVRNDQPGRFSGKSFPKPANDLNQIFCQIANIAFRNCRSERILIERRVECAWGARHRSQPPGPASRPTHNGRGPHDPAPPAIAHALV